jgi:6-phosphogluconolactonase (cycloisomerase 2 family)
MAMLIDGAVAAGQTAACWLATTPNGRMAYTADTPADAISSFAIDKRGHVSLLQSKAGAASRPTDLAVSSDGRLLYSLNGGDHTISSYRIARRGGLAQGSSLDSIPPHATGLIVE